MIRTHPYEANIDTAEWYVKSERDPRHLRTGSWGWELLMQSISMGLSCRYQASLWKNRVLYRRANELLRIMIIDLLRDPYIKPAYKLTRLIMTAFPALYRSFRLKNDPTMKAFERSVYEKRKSR